MGDRRAAWQELAGKHRGRLGVAACAVAVAASVLVWAWSAGSERRTLAEVPAQERAVMFERVRSAAESVCEPPRAHDLRERCEELAQFMLEFPECDARCGAFVRSVSSQPAR